MSSFEQTTDKALAWFEKRPVFICVLPVIFSLVLILYLLRSADPDLFARVAMGRLIAVNGGIPLLDVFAFTPVKSVWYDHEWLSGLVFYYLSQAGGDWLLFFFAVAVSSGALFFLVLTALNHGVSKVHAAAWSFLCMFCASFGMFSIVRSHCFTFLFLSLYYFLFSQYRKTGRAFWLLPLPLCMIFWANAHGGFVVGLGMTGIFFLVSCIDKKIRALPVFFSLLFSLAATLVNPYGIHFWDFILEAVSMDRSSQIREWGMLDIVWSLKLFLPPLIWGIILWGVFRVKNAVPLEGRIFLLLTLFFGIRHYRLIVLFYLTAMAYGGPFFTALWSALRGRFPERVEAWGRSAAWALFLNSLAGLGFFAAFVLQGPSFSLGYQAYPVKAMQWLQQNGQGGRLLTHFNDGSFALWRGYPEYQISLDGRFEEVYPPETVKMVSDIYWKKSGQDENLKRLNPDYVLVCKVKGQDVFDTAKFEKQYSLIYMDPLCRIFGHEAAPGGPAGPDKEAPIPVWQPLF